MKLKYLMIGLAILIAANIDWDLLWHKDYRDLHSFSQKATVSFEKKLMAEMSNHKEISMNTLTDFDWDTVCLMDGYSHLREDMAKPYAYGKDLTELEYFPNVGEAEVAFVFLQSSKVIAVIMQLDPKVVKIKQQCTSSKMAAFQLIYPVTYSPPMGVCKNGLGSTCQLIFKGEGR